MVPRFLRLATILLALTPVREAWTSPPDRGGDPLEEAAALHERGDDVGAARLLERARAQDPQGFEPFWRQAYHRLVLANRLPDRKERAGRIRQVLPQVDTLLRVHGNRADAWFVGALASGIQSTTVPPRRRVELSKQVRDRIEGCLSRDPKHPGAWFLLGRWHEGFATLNPLERTFVDLLLGGMPEGASLDSARLALERADRLRPDDLQILTDLVRVLDLQGRSAAARALARRALDVPPRHETDRKALEALRTLLSRPAGG